MKQIQEETKHAEKEFGAAGCNYGKQTMMVEVKL